MPSMSVEVGSSSGGGGGGGGSSAPSGGMVQVFFPSAQASVLDSLNRQREDGQLCDLAIHVQGQVFKAHRCVLAASSPYFHDQVLLKNMSTVSIPAVMDPLAFESVLSCAYTGQLRMLREDIVNYLTVGSVLQMWHIVDKCTELLKEGRGLSGGGNSEGGGVQTRGGEGETSSNAGCSSSNGDGVLAGSTGGVQAQGVESQLGSQRPTRVSVSESQSPSSTNYFSPREGSSFGGGNVTTVGAATDTGRTSTTASYCPLSAGDEALLIGDEEEEEEEEEEEDSVLYNQRRRRAGSRKRKKNLSEQEDGVSDSFGVSSYQDGEESVTLLPRRPTYSQPSIMPRKQWVVVKTERPEDDDLIVVSGEEGEGYEEDEDEREIESDKGSERKDFNISNIRSLSGEAGGRGEDNMDSPMDYCQSSEDYLKFEGTLMEQTLVQHLHDNAPGQSANRAVSALLTQVQSAATARAQLFPLDMQGNQILLYSQTSGLSLDTPAGGAAAPALGMAGGLLGGAAFKGLEHGAVHLSVPNGLGLDGMEGGAGGAGGAGGGGGGGSAVSSGGSGKVFMCHCGKTFTHKSMRDRHINMHLDLRPFNCPVCAKKFKMKHHLTEHMKTHTGLKPYDCSGCGKKFMWRDSFMRHRSNCERHGRPEEREEVGGDGRRRGGGGGEDGPDLMSSPHLLLQNGEGAYGNANVVGLRRGVGSASATPSPHLSSSVMSVQHSNSGIPAKGSSHAAAAAAAVSGAALIVPQSPGQGHVTGIFSGLGHDVCSEEVSDVGVNDSSLS